MIKEKLSAPLPKKDRVPNLRRLLQASFLSATMSFAAFTEDVYNPKAQQDIVSQTYDLSANYQKDQTKKMINWVDRLNWHRAAAYLPPIEENSEWDSSCIAHSKYLVKNRTSGHHQNPQNSYFSEEGALCGRSGNVITTGNLKYVYDSASIIDLWMSAPFHAIGMLNPSLTYASLGQHHETIGDLQYFAATLDILRGIDLSKEPEYPVMWPGHNSTTDLTEYAGSEFPDPLSACKGYTPRTGLPILLLTGNNNVVNLEQSSLIESGRTLEHCIISENSYQNSNPFDQSLAKAVMGRYGAIILIPKEQLSFEKTYQVQIATSETTYRWRFHVKK